MPDCKTENKEHVFPKVKIDGSYKCSVCGYPEFPPNMLVFDDGRHGLDCDCFDCREGKTTRVGEKRVMWEGGIVFFGIIFGGGFLIAALISKFN